METCLNCKKEFTKKDPRQKFCSMNCAGIHSNANRVLSEESKENIKRGLMKFWETHPEMRRQNGIDSSKGKYYGNIKSILDVSTRTAHKIIKRIGLGCCVCGWNESSCDIHHINGKKVENANGHWNLTLLCPNHHRLFHNKKLKKCDVKTLDEYFPKSWNEFYYG